MQSAPPSSTMPSPAPRWTSDASVCGERGGKIWRENAEGQGGQANSTMSFIQKLRLISGQIHECMQTPPPKCYKRGRAVQRALRVCLPRGCFAMNTELKLSSVDNAAANNCRPEKLRAKTRKSLEQNQNSAMNLHFHTTSMGLRSTNLVHWHNHSPKLRTLFPCLDFSYMNSGF